MPVLLATCADLPDGDEDSDVLLAALEDAGVAARWAAWTDPAMDWSAGLTVLRSTWDYTHARDRFLEWVRALPQVANPAPVVEWSTDKTYLADLAAAGVPTVPTAVVAPGQALPQLTGDEVIVKPSVGAGSRGVGRFTQERFGEAQEHAEKLHAAGRTVLVQPYLADVDVTGEAALIFFAGAYSHAITKGAMIPAGTTHPVEGGSLFVEENIHPRRASEAEVATAEAAVAYVRERFGDQLYARVDLLPGPDGPVVVELELVEPSLFLKDAPGAAARFAAAIAERA